MFTWICPQCGREVPPSENECPDCSSRAAAQERRAAPVSGATGAVRPQARGARKLQFPGWLLAVLFAAGFGAIGYGAYLGYRHFSGAASGARETSPADSASTTLPDKTPSILGRYIEVAGLRLTEDPASKKLQMRFLLVNHSGAEIAELSGKVKLRTATGSPDDQPVGVFAFKVDSLGPYEAKDLQVTVESKLRAYELPDWQFLRADVQLSSP